MQVQCVLIIIVSVVLELISPIASESKEVVCYYNARSHYRPGHGKFEFKHLDEALHICTYLVYGHAVIEANSYQLLLPDELSHPSGNHTVHLIDDLKQRFPHLTILLSVGGGQDLEDQNAESSETITKYLTLLESKSHQSDFVSSVVNVLRSNGFDGLDLAWQFPKTTPKNFYGFFSDSFDYMKTVIFGEEIIDRKSEEHKEQFTALVKDLKDAIRNDGFKLTLSVLPNIKHSAFFHPGDLGSYLDLVTLMAFDFYHPLRTPAVADYPAPLYELPGRRPDENAEYQITYWSSNSFPKEKLILGIPAYGRAWKINSDTEFTGSLPITADGPANPGIFCTEPGLLSYSEICSRLPSPQCLFLPIGTKLDKISDSYGKDGSYAVHMPTYKGEYSFWVGYDDADTAGKKATFAKETNLGGIAIVDITLDDFHGVCDQLYPILRAAAFKLRT